MAPLPVVRAERLALKAHVHVTWSQSQSARWKRASVFFFCAAVLPLPLGVILEGVGALPDGGTVELGLPVACAGALGHIGVLIALLRMTGAGAAERRALLRRLFWTGGLGLLSMTLALSEQLARRPLPSTEEVRGGSAGGGDVE